VAEIMKKTCIYLSVSLIWCFVLPNLNHRAALAEPPSAAVISKVSKDCFEFDPQKGETLTLSYHLSAPAEITVRFFDPFHSPVKTIHQKAERAGIQETVWNGLDDANRSIPAEAYTYTIIASSRNTPTDVTTYDPSRTTGGDALPPQNADIDREARYISYSLSKAARVRMHMSRGPFPVGTLIDWAPRAPGTHREYWEASIDPFNGTGDLPPIGATFNAFALPDNSIILKGGGGSRPPASMPSPLPHRLDLDLPGDDIQVHAVHPRARCYDPVVVIELPVDTQRTSTGVPRITRPTILRFDLAPSQRPGYLAPIPRASISVHVDGTRVDGQSATYLPYNWVLDPSLLIPGEHLISGVISWKEDHFGFVHVRVSVETQIR
jgi:hypothetical protein